jgi:4-amino-4-deoxy-L-arabinose transferase-like glycosyltransferase
VALVLALTYLGAALVLAPDYGPTWDCVKGEYKWGEYLLAYLMSDEGDLLDETSDRFRLEHRQPYPDFDHAGFPWYEMWPVSALLSAVSVQIFWTHLGWLAPFVALNLAVMVLVALLIFVVVRFFGSRLGLAVGASAALFMVLSPRFFAHSFNNVRDMPEACLYGFTLMACYLAFTRPKLRWWALTGALAGLALAQKPNALFLPVQMGLFLVAALIYERIRKEKHIQWSFRGLVLSAGTFLAVYFAASPTFWEDTWERLKVQFGFIMRRGNVMLDSTAPSGEGAGISLHGLTQVLITTPPALLVLSLVGLFAGRCHALLRIFLIVWVAVPVGRVTLPGMLNFDGIRHFIEFYPALCVLAGLGLSRIMDEVTRRLNTQSMQVAAKFLLFAAALAPGAVATASTHPNGLCYYNMFVGGLGGAQARGIPDAGDYWANSYWQGLEWLNENAEEGACLLVPVAWHVVDCAAPVKLRKDIRLCRSGTESVEAPLYVMYITRPGWYDDLAEELDYKREPHHEISVQGGVILRIHRMEDPADAAAMFDLWRNYRAKLSLYRLGKWLETHPQKKREFIEIEKAFKAGKGEEVRQRLFDALPPNVKGNFPELYWYMERMHSK